MGTNRTRQNGHRNGNGVAPALDTVLVIGGAGFVGTVLTRALLERGHEVTVLDPMLYGADGLSDLRGDDRLSLVEGDARDIESLVRSAAGKDAVVHLGAIVGDPACAIDESLTLDVNLNATRTVGAVARGLGIERLVFASTCSVYGASEVDVDETSPTRPVSLYARTKLESESSLLALHDELFAPVVLRFGTLYGLSPRPRFDLVVNRLVALAETTGTITVFGGGQWRPFVHVHDAARAVMRCLEVDTARIGGRVFNVGSDEQNLTMAEMAELIAANVPGSRVAIEPAAEVEANYRVSFARIRDELDFFPERSLIDGIVELRDAVARGELSDFTDPKYSNVEALTSGALANPWAATVESPLPAGRA